MSEKSDDRKPTSVLLLSVFVLGILLLLGLSKVIGVVMLAGSSAGGTLSSGRSVVTYSDSSTLSSKLTRDTATFRTAGHTIEITPTRLVIDGNLVGTISPEVSKVEVHVERGAVEFVTDGNRWAPIP